MTKNAAQEELSQTATVEPGDGFRVAFSTHVLSSMVWNLRGCWKRLGNLETSFLQDSIADIGVRRPVFVSGLARSGTTVVLEFLAAHDGVATHRYRDFPFLFTPYWWNRFVDRVPRRELPREERTHRDGILVTPESPEAMEEMLWMAFFAKAHDCSESGILDRQIRNPKFERFFRQHIRKLLFVRGGQRYVSKNNYNVARLEYLMKLFPDCRFVIPVRDPVLHVASLMRQHRLFCEGERRHRRALDHMRRVGHYEFGLDRRPINAGDTAAVDGICRLWAGGEEVRAWARYWGHVYGHVAGLLDSNAAVRQATMALRFEDLCEQPLAVLSAVSSHCGLRIDEAKREKLAAGIRVPTYYRVDFSQRDIDIIRSETRAVARRFGYGSDTTAATGGAAARENCVWNGTTR